MNSKVQLICIIYSLIYGFYLYKFILWNLKIINKFNILFKIIINILFINGFVLLYVLFLYKINGGILHYYFILSIIGGVLISIFKSVNLIK